MIINDFEMDCYAKPQDAVFKNVEMVSFEKEETTNPKKEEMESNSNFINCISYGS